MSEMTVALNQAESSSVAEANAALERAPCRILAAEDCAEDRV